MNTHDSALSPASLYAKQVDARQSNGRQTATTGKAKYKVDPGDTTHSFANGTVNATGGNRTATTHCILLVEDHEESARIMVRLLDRAGHKTHAALTAAQALQLLETVTPTVVLSDLNLPDGDGYSLVTRMRSMPALVDCVFVALTGSKMLDPARVGTFDHHLIKPVDMSYLRQFLSELNAAGQ